MLEQTFSYGDIARVLTLIFLETVLSADNMVAIATITTHLSLYERKRARNIGILSGILLRVVALAFFVFLVDQLWFQIIGALYLYYLFATYFLKKSSSKDFSNPLSFWKTIMKVEVVDFAFAVDSLVAAIVFIAPFRVPGRVNPKLWIVLVGGAVGLIGVRFGAEFVSRWVGRFPKLATSSYLLMGWIAFHLSLDVIFQLTGHWDWAQSLLVDIILWLGIVMILLWGVTSSGEKKRKRTR